MIKYSLIYGFLTSGYKSLDVYTIRKLVFLNSFLILGIFAFVVMGLYNVFFFNYPKYVLVDVFMIISCAISFFFLRKYQKEQFVIFYISFIVALFVLSFTYINHNKNFGLIWVYFVPPFLIFLNGHKKGLIFSFIFLALILIIMNVNYTKWQEIGWHTGDSLRFYIALVFDVFFAFVSEYIFSKLQSELEKLSITDALTGLSNRRRIDEIMKKEVEKRNRLQFPLTFVILDIDDFKKINDKYGHLKGDDVLRQIAKIIAKNIRIYDSVGRWGGEEFCLILPQTSLNNALVILERLRKTIENTKHDIDEVVTCSFGVCSTENEKISQTQLIKKADLSLYQAKKEGKNKICFQRA